LRTWEWISGGTARDPARADTTIGRQHNRAVKCPNRLNISAIGHFSETPLPRSPGCWENRGESCPGSRSGGSSRSNSESHSRGNLERSREDCSTRSSTDCPDRSWESCRGSCGENRPESCPESCSPNCSGDSLVDCSEDCPENRSENRPENCGTDCDVHAAPMCGTTVIQDSGHDPNRPSAIGTAQVAARSCPLAAASLGKSERDGHRARPADLSSP
jgi:hypothetical protein